MTNVAATLNSLKAEVLLVDNSYILTQIGDLLASLSLPSDGVKLNYEDWFDRLEERIDRVPHITLLQRIPPMQAQDYLIELAESLHTVQDIILALQNQALKFQAHLVESQNAIADMSATFDVWYSVSAAAKLKEAGIKNLSQAVIKGMARSEFNRLMVGTPVRITSLLEAVRAALKQLEAKKKTVREKFEIGREQVNAAYMNRLLPTPAVSSQPGSMGLMTEPEPENLPALAVERPRLNAPLEDVLPGTVDEDPPGNVFVSADVPDADVDILADILADSIPEELPAPGFVKRVPPALMTEISWDQALEAFTDERDEGIETEPGRDEDPIDKTLAAEETTHRKDTQQQENQRDEMEDATEAADHRERTEQHEQRVEETRDLAADTAANNPEIIRTIIDDELDDLILKFSPRIPVIDMDEAPADVIPAPKPQSFPYSDDIA